MPLSTFSSEGLYPPTGRADREVRNLAIGILIQAFRDIMPRKNPNRRTDEWKEDALDWFFSDAFSAGSFLWVCRVLRATPVKMRDWIQFFLTRDATEQKEMGSQLIHYRLRPNH